MSAWANTVDQALQRHGTDSEKGLTTAQVTKLQAEFGPNKLDEEEGTPLWKLVLAQFDDLLVKILLGAATLSFVSVPPIRLLLVLEWLRALARPLLNRCQGLALSPLDAVDACRCSPSSRMARRQEAHSWSRS